MFRRLQVLLLLRRELALQLADPLTQGGNVLFVPHLYLGPRGCLHHFGLGEHFWKCRPRAAVLEQVAHLAVLVVQQPILFREGVLLLNK